MFHSLSILSPRIILTVSLNTHPDSILNIVPMWLRASATGTDEVLYNRKYSRAGNFQDFCEFPRIRENFLHANIIENLLYPKIREIFMSRNFPVIQYINFDQIKSKLVIQPILHITCPSTYSTKASVSYKSCISPVAILGWDAEDP